MTGAAQFGIICFVMQIKNNISLIFPQVVYLVNPEICFPIVTDLVGNLWSNSDAQQHFAYSLR